MTNFPYISPAYISSFSFCCIQKFTMFKMKDKPYTQDEILHHIISCQSVSKQQLVLPFLKHIPRRKFEQSPLSSLRLFPPQVLSFKIVICRSSNCPKAAVICSVPSSRQNIAALSAGKNILPGTTDVLFLAYFCQYEEALNRFSHQCFLLETTNCSNFLLFFSP